MSIKNKPESRVTLEDLISASSRVGAVIESVRGTMLAPDARKRSPTFSTNQVATVCGLEKAQMDYRVKKGDLPTGDMESGHRRKFSLEDTRIWARSIRSKYMRPEQAGHHDCRREFQRRRNKDHHCSHPCPRFKSSRSQGLGHRYGSPRFDDDTFWTAS